MPFHIFASAKGPTTRTCRETHAVIKRIRAELDSYAPGKVLLAEANQWPEDVSAYFGDGDECHMAYHFPLMPRIYMAIAQEDRFPDQPTFSGRPPTSRPTVSGLCSCAITTS